MRAFKGKAMVAMHIVVGGMAALSSVDAFAQFTVIDQRGLLVTSASSQVTTSTVSDPGSTLQTDSHSNGISPGDLSNQNLSAQASVSNDFAVTSQASLRTMATSTAVGLSDDISLSFKQQASTLSPNLTVSGSVAVVSSLTFTVDTPTDVIISTSLPNTPVFSVQTLYSNWTLFAQDSGVIIGSTSNSPLPGSLLTPIQSTGGLVHLDIGKYVIELNSQYAPPDASNGPTISLGQAGVTAGNGMFVTPYSLPLASASITITSVPEPGTLPLSLLGTLGIASLYRQRRSS